MIILPTLKRGGKLGKKKLLPVPETEPVPRIDTGDTTHALRSFRPGFHGGDRVDVLHYGLLVSDEFLRGRERIMHPGNLSNLPDARSGES
jgi:hypothetical protein